MCMNRPYYCHFIGLWGSENKQDLPWVLEAEFIREGSSGGTHRGTRVSLVGRSPAFAADFYFLELGFSQKGLQMTLGSAKRQWESKRLLSSLNKTCLKSWSSEAEWVGRQREHGLNKPRDPWLHSHLELGRAGSCLITKKAGLATGWSWSSCQCRAVILDSWDRRTNVCRWQGLGFAIRWAWAQTAAVTSSTTVAKLLHCSKPQLSWKLNKIMSV